MEGRISLKEAKRHSSAYCFCCSYFVVTGEKVKQGEARAGDVKLICGE